MYSCKNTSLHTGGSLTHKTSAGARTICQEIFEMDGCHWNCMIQALNKNRPVPVRCVQTSAVDVKVAPKLHRAPYDV